MLKHSILTATALAFFASSASAATIVAYDTVNSAGSIAGQELGLGITAADLTRGSGLVYNSAGGDYNSRNWTDSILASINGGAFTSIFGDSDISTTGETNMLTLMATNVTSAVFRLAGWSATGSSGTFDIETDEVGPNGAYGLAITGEISPVPLPASLAFLMAGIGALGVARRRA